MNLEIFHQVKLGHENDTDLRYHTASSLNCHLRCTKLHEYRYELGYKSVESITAFLVGSAVHIGLEAFWNGATCREARNQAIRFMDGEEFFKTDTGLVERAKVGAYIYGYYARWESERHLYEVIQPELEFSFVGRMLKAPGYGHVLVNTAGKLDVLVRRKSDGQLIIIEHKTASKSSKASEPGSPYWSKLGMDTQLCFYIDNIHALTGETPEVMYDVVIKSSARPMKSKARKRKTETDAQFEQRRAETDETIAAFRARVIELYTEHHLEKEPYEPRFIRKMVHITPGEVKRKMGELAYTMRSIENKDLRIRNTSACSSYGSTCEFMDVCNGVAQLDDPRFEKKEVMNEELSV